MRVGLVGLGYMGAPMGSRLAECGHTLTVFDIDASRATDLCAKGAVLAENPAGVGEASDVVFTSLSNLEAIRAVVLGESDGLLTTMRPGSTLVELSTNSYALTKELASRSQAVGVGYLDCPVSGGGGGPASGSLTLMVGGDDEVVERCRSVLGDLGNIFHVGPTGSGTAAKLVTQYLGYTSMMAGLEALVMAEGAGVDLNILFDIIPVSAARGRFSQNVADELKVRDFGDQAGARPSMPVYIIEKDVKLAIELGHDLGTPVELGMAGHELLAEALRRGWDESSFSRTIEILEEHAGIKPKP